MGCVYMCTNVCLNFYLQVCQNPSYCKWKKKQKFILQKAFQLLWTSHFYWITRLEYKKKKYNESKALHVQNAKPTKNKNKNKAAKLFFN